MKLNEFLRERGLPTKKDFEALSDGQQALLRREHYEMTRFNQLNSYKRFVSYLETHDGMTFTEFAARSDVERAEIERRFWEACCDEDAEKEDRESRYSDVKPVSVEDVPIAPF